MSEWKMVRLGDIFDLQMGKTPDRNRPEYFNTNTNKWVSIADISKAQKYILETKECISDEAVKNSGIKQIPANTIIMSFKLSIGKTAIATEPMYSNEAIMAFLPNGKYEVDNNFFYHLFSNKNWSEGSNKAVKGVTLNKATLTEVKIPLPPIDEQKHIAAMLDKCADIIAKRKQQLSELDDLIKARFVEMFGDPVQNPKGWKFVSLDELTDVGSSKRIFEKEYVNAGVPFYRTKEIVELAKGNSISTELFITNERYEEIKDLYGVPKIGDLLISAVGTIGTIWIVDGKKDFYYKDGNIIRVNKSSKFNSKYMKYLLENLIAEYKKQMSFGTAYAALTISGLSKMQVWNVPVEKQNQFANLVEEIDKTKSVIQKALDETKLLFDSLMQQYFG